LATCRSASPFPFVVILLTYPLRPIASTCAAKQFDSLVPLGKNNQFIGNSAQAHDGAISCAGRPQLGINFTSVDPSNVLTGSQPDHACGL
jgi:hypothetical protein